MELSRATLYLTTSNCTPHVARLDLWLGCVDDAQDASSSQAKHHDFLVRVVSSIQSLVWSFFAILEHMVCISPSSVYVSKDAAP